MTISPTVFNAVLLATIPLTQALTAYITNYLSAQRAQHLSGVTEASAEKLAEVTKRQEDKIDAVARTADKTHALVNSQMGEVLGTLLVSAQALYDAIPTEKHAALLKEAEMKLQEQEARQRLADRS